MSDDDLFTQAMLAYDAEGRHSEGIRAVVDLVRADTRRRIAAALQAEFARRDAERSDPS